MLLQQFILDSLCLQSFSMIFSMCMRRAKHDLIILTYDETAPKIDDIMKISQNDYSNWLIFPSTTNLQQTESFKSVIGSKLRVFQLFIVGDLDTEWCTKIYAKTALFFFITKNTARMKQAEKNFIKKNSKCLNASNSAIVIFCNDDETQHIYYSYMPGRGLNFNEFKYLENCERNYTLASNKIKIRAALNTMPPNVRVYNSGRSNGIAVTGSDIFLLNFIANNLENEIIYFMPTVQFKSSKNSKNVYREISNAVITPSKPDDFVSFLGNYYLLVSPINYVGEPIFWYDFNEVRAVIVQPYSEEAFVMHAIILWLLISLSSAILIFIFRILTRTQGASLSDTFLRSLSAVLGYGNVNFTRRAHRSERLFLMSLLIFGLFFDIFYTENLFRSTTFGPENKRYKSIEELYTANITIYQEIGFYPNSLGAQLSSKDLINIWFGF